MTFHLSVSSLHSGANINFNSLLTYIVTEEHVSHSQRHLVFRYQVPATTGAGEIKEEIFCQVEIQKNHFHTSAGKSATQMSETVWFSQRTADMFNFSTTLERAQGPQDNWLYYKSMIQQDRRGVCPLINIDIGSQIFMWWLFPKEESFIWRMGLTGNDFGGSFINKLGGETLA